MTDALDRYTVVRFRPDPAKHTAELDRLRWPAFLAIWDRIGKDFGIDYLWWQATNESLRGFDHGPVSPERQAEARRFLVKMADKFDFSKYPPMTNQKDV